MKTYLAKKLIPAAVSAALLFGALNLPAASRIFSINANGIKEVNPVGIPNGDPDGSAIGTLTLDNGTGGNTGFAIFNLSLQNLDFPLSAHHIHQAPTTTTGGVVLGFGNPETMRTGNTLSGTVPNLSSATINGIFANPGAFYYNLHNTPFPGGAVRDQLTAPSSVLGFTVNSYSLLENSGSATITVERTGGNSGIVAVDYATADGTSLAGVDYLPANGTLLFAAGETTKTFSIPVLDDALVEGNETVNLVLFNPTGGAMLGANVNAVLTIVNDDQPSIVSFTVSSYSVLESGGIATITVQRTGGSSGFVSVNFTTADGTASAGIDYLSANGTVTFGPGETSKAFSIPILDDALVEGNETVNLILSNPTGGAMLGAKASATLTIVDDNQCPVARISFMPLCVMSNATTMLLVAGEDDHACIVFGGTLSTDAEGDPLTYSWLADGGLVPFSVAALNINCFAIGDHDITLMVDDGQCFGRETVHLEVVTACDLVENLIQDINNSTLPRNKKRPLIDSLKKICKQFEKDKKNKFKYAIKKLEGFQKKVKKELKDYPVYSAVFCAEAQAIIDAVNCAVDIHEKKHKHDDH